MEKVKLPFRIDFGDVRTYLTIQYLLTGFDIGYKAETEDSFRMSVYCEFNYQLKEAKKVLLKAIKKRKIKKVYYQERWIREK